MISKPFGLSFVEVRLLPESSRVEDGLLSDHVLDSQSHPNRVAAITTLAFETSEISLQTSLSNIGSLKNTAV
jgi:hypothetical protein